MASAGSPPPLPKALPPSAARAWPSREWPPRAHWQRWAIRLGGALPLVALAVWAHHHGFVSPGLQLLEQRARLVVQGGANLRGVRYGYPPLPVLLAIVLPGGALGLSIAACVFSGFVLEFIAERLLRRLPVLVTFALLLAFAAVPAMWYASSQLLAADGALAFLALALGAFIRFVAFGRTEGGFVAGIALAVSFCFDPAAVMYALVMCAFVPLISHARYHGRPAAATSIAAVLLFPLAAIILSWLFLIWRFSGTFPGSLSYAAGAHLFAFRAGVWAGLGTAALRAATDLAHVPLYLAAAALLSRRRPVILLGFGLPVLALILSLWLGFAYSQVTAFFMFTILALLSLASMPSERYQKWLLAAAAAQLALAVAWPPASPGFAAWLQAVT